MARGGHREDLIGEIGGLRGQSFGSTDHIKLRQIEVQVQGIEDELEGRAGS